MTCPIESSTILLNHPWSPCLNRFQSLDYLWYFFSSFVFQDLSSLVSRARPSIHLSLFSIDHKEEGKRKKTFLEPFEELISRNNSICVSDQPWAWSKGKKFTQSTKSTVHQGSTQRLIPPRCEKNRCCWTAERVFYRFVDLSLDTVHAMSIPRYQSDHPLPLLSSPSA